MLGSSTADALLAFVNAEQVRAEQAVADGQVKYDERFGAVNNRSGHTIASPSCSTSMKGGNNAILFKYHINVIVHTYIQTQSPYPTLTYSNLPYPSLPFPVLCFSQATALRHVSAFRGAGGAGGAAGGGVEPGSPADQPGEHAAARRVA